jgi:hypothetical protein
VRLFAQAFVKRSAGVNYQTQIPNVNNGFDNGLPASHRMPLFRVRLQAIRESVSELRDVIDEQHEYTNEIDTIVCDIEEELTALIVR